MRLPRRLPTKLILISAVFIGIGAGATLYMVQETQSEAPASHNSAQPTSESKSISVDDQSMEQSVLVASSDAPQATEPIEANTNPPAEPMTQETAPDAPKAHAFASEMVAAGIAESDFDTVDRLVLNPAGWRVIPFQDRPFTWRLARQVQGSLTNKLKHLKSYVDYYYGGDFSKALETANLRGNF